MTIELNPWLIAYVLIFLFTTTTETAVALLNIRHLRESSTDVLKLFSGYIGTSELQESRLYNADLGRFGIVEHIADNILFIFLLLTGVFQWYSAKLLGLNPILGGLVFFGGIGFLFFLFGLPLGYYECFVIEEKYGFNTRTRKLWTTDTLKSLVLGAILGCALLLAILLLIRYGGSTWWLWGWGIFLAFQILIVLIYPTLIAPIFNKFTPLEDDELKAKIKHLLELYGITLRNVYQMDASKRSTHSNAYFTGLGKTKRIVLFDSLLKNHDEEEILAILAHEAGHYRGRHLYKQLALLAGVSFVFFLLASRLISWGPLFQVFGFTKGSPPYVGLFILAILWKPAGFFISPLISSLSRKYEKEADLFAMKAMGSGHALARALKKMARDNLANLSPHPLYVWLHYSHPPLAERIAALEEGGKS